MEFNFQKPCDPFIISEIFFEQIKKLPDGMWQVEIRKPKRTLKQNRAIHGLFTRLAAELEGLGIELNFGNFTASWNPDTAKEFFKQIYLNGKGTSKTNTAELSDAVNKLIHDVNLKGGQLSITSEEMRALERKYNLKTISNK